MKKSEEVKSWQDLSLSAALFWDTDASKIGLDTHAKTIVERVFMRGRRHGSKPTVRGKN